ncbi:MULTISPECIES: DUF4350 domain-containing protein [Streptomyces]|uniref:DUF4350 domain-containing protein n=1 Tax=Streptomyces tsukubensis (strain DSM 42081 / NBRC 108919 / NRRL 18488 / 9993) TaxID=1114943 RepID=I2MZ58_STRT9|nr:MULTISPECIES: DUF4350 domain-containing protein [Streptomyces]AZK94326.1 hypothetical protein B7R87_10980 [Streptomyces tsukubensis]EIF90055.1 hypothetical protein [Streptomyces tsukubensis NRRL18488]MYS62796.1 DUF4350 domain-containing protein [Streptomyces sp. SID5473]QKM69582.1 DUF4350 domain-containing protein [Streptomyces tsukubensis NRRL18488]TAI46458.1 DUF4350 domain-containing protein [Streptomyces tsukubensis]
MTAATGPTSLSPTGRQIWRRARGLLLALLIVVVTGIVIAALRSGDRHGALDPRSADPHGSRAVAELLKDRGVTTRVVTTLSEAASATGSDTTLLVTDPDLLTPAQQRSLRTAMEASNGRTVLLSPGPTSVTTLAPGTRSAGTGPAGTVEPECSLPAARDAGSAELGGEQYLTDASAADTCYPVDGVPTLVRTDTGDGDTVLLGSPRILHNERLAESGNAALALQLLGSRPHLVWYLPSVSDGSAAPGEGDKSFVELVPSGWLWGALQLFVAAALAAVWRGRRLGPLVPEQLPVVVRASETTEGRARLYHRAKARDHAAAALRAATRSRIAPLLGVPPSSAHLPAVLLPAFAGRHRAGERDLTELLFGRPPVDDTELVRLADHLDALEREVRTS